MRLRTVCFWMAWTLLHTGLFIYGFLFVASDPQVILNSSLGYSLWMARGAAAVLTFDAAILVLPLCRNLARALRTTFLSNLIPFDEAIFLHKQTAYSLLFFTLVHVSSHEVNFIKAASLNLDPISLHFTTVFGATGHLMLVCIFLMYTAAQSNIRKQAYELFWYTHHLFIVFYLAFAWHGSGCFIKREDGECKTYHSWAWMVAALIIYIVERITRALRSHRKTVIGKVILHKCQTLEVRFRQSGLKYKAGQYVFLNIPSISYFQWHPFTLTSFPEEGFVSVHVRLVGDWTRSMGEVLAPYDRKNQLQQSLQIPTILVDGPYGAPAQDCMNEEVAVLVGAGIGVTPFASILKLILFRIKNKLPMKLKKVYFFWISKHLEEFSWFYKLLKVMENANSRDQIVIELYLTALFSPEDTKCIMYHSPFGKDPLTSLKSPTNYGRPQFQSLFGRIKRDIQVGIKGLTRNEGISVSVFACGPPSMMKSIKNAVKEQNDKIATFILRKERF